MPLYAGAAEIDITPPLGTQLAGDIGRLRPVLEIRDPLYARALVLENDGCKIALLSLDLTLIGTPWGAKIRQRAAALLGIPVEAILVHGSQTHSAPALGHCFTDRETPYFPKEHAWLGGGDDAYMPFAVDQSVTAIAEANEKLEPVMVGSASGIEARVAFNRRFVMRDGKTVTHPRSGDPNIRCSEGPIDPEVGIACFRNRDEQVIAALLHYTSHPNHGYPKQYVSADWPGTWSAGVKELLSPGAVPLVINGCCGNIHHTNHLDPRHVDDQDKMGAMLTEVTRGALSRIEYKEVDTLGWNDRHLSLPWRDLDPAAVAEAHALLAEHPEPMWLNEEHTVVDWKWVYAVSLVDLEDQIRRNPGFDYEIQAFRIGELALVTLPGEPFVEAQLQIKLESPTYPTYVAHMSNIYGGYIPTAHALARGGFETNPANWSKLGPSALGEIAAAAGELLQESYGRAGIGPVSTEFAV